MLRYILKRILQFIPVFLGVTLILFIMQNVVPGDPIKLIAGEKKMDPQTEMNIRAAHGLIVTDENGNIVITFPAGAVTDAAHGEQTFRLPRP